MIAATSYFVFSQYIIFHSSQEHFAQDRYDQTQRYLNSITYLQNTQRLNLVKKVASLPEQMKKISGDDALMLYQNREDTMPKAQSYLSIGETKKLSPDFMASLDIHKAIQPLTLSGENYLLSLYPIDDTVQENTAVYLGVLHRMDQFYQEYREQLVLNFIFFLGFFLVSFYLMRRYLQKSSSHISQVRHLTQEYENLELQLDEKTQEIQNAYHDLESVHYRDSLTQLPNRLALLRDISSFSSGTLVIFDIAKFNGINDSYGIAIGNAFLVRFSEFMSAMSEGKDVVLYRVDSDQFICISREGIIAFQQWFSSVLEQVEKEVFTFSDGIEISVQLHAGISDISEHAIENATLALGYAKKHQLEYFIYTESLQSLHKDKEDTAMIKVIKTAILDERVIPYFQPIVDKNGSIQKYEALMRIRLNGRIVSPVEFLSVARRSKYYHRMTRIMIQKSLALFRDRNESVSINLNMIDIKNTTTVMLILDELKKFPDASRVIFELVESESMESVDEVLDFISAIKVHGAKIAIDDFGTGYSNFSYMMEMNPDFIKIDGSMVGSIDHDEQAVMIVKSIIEFTHALGIESVGEYIHNETVFQKAKDLGIDAFQGNYFYLPHSNLKKEDK